MVWSLERLINGNRLAGPTNRVTASESKGEKENRKHPRTKMSQTDAVPPSHALRSSVPICPVRLPGSPHRENLNWPLRSSGGSRGSGVKIDMTSGAPGRSQLHLWQCLKSPLREALGGNCDACDRFQSCYGLKALLVWLCFLGVYLPIPTRRIHRSLSIYGPTQLHPPFESMPKPNHTQPNRQPHWRSY